MYCVVYGVRLLRKGGLAGWLTGQAYLMAGALDWKPGTATATATTRMTTVTDGSKHSCSERSRECQEGRERLGCLG